jgi:hypothetical protein
VFSDNRKNELSLYSNKEDMTGDIVYETLLSYIRKDKRGLSLSIDEFNRMSVTVDKRILIAFCSRFEDDIEISSHMGFLKVLDYPLALTDGVTSLPDNYFRMISDPYYIDANGIKRNIDVVTSEEHNYREMDYLTKSTLRHPTCVIGAQSSAKRMQLRVYPTTTALIYINYIRDTVSPFLDYYIHNTTLQVTYLLEGLPPFVVSNPYTYRDGTTGSKTGITKDWEWDLHELPWILAYFLQTVGVAIPDELLVQVGKIDSKEIQSGQIW